MVFNVVFDNSYCFINEDCYLFKFLKLVSNVKNGYLC